jgi:hypothetical protein
MAGRNGHSNGQTQPSSPPLPPNANGRAGGGHNRAGHFKPGNRVGEATRFKAGNRQAKGHANAFARDVARVRAALFRHLTDGNMKAVVGALVAMVTKQHDLAAAQLLLSYCIGPPMKTAADPDRVDLHELALLQECPSPDAPVPLKLPMDAALVLHRAAQALAAVARVADELSFAGSKPHVLDALREANLTALAEAAQRYADQLERMNHEPG